MATHTFTDDGKVALDVNVTNSGGGGSSQVEVTNFPETQAVSVSNVGTTGDANTLPATSYFNSRLGTGAEAAWGGTGNATMIAIMKALYTQNATMIGLLEEIRDNTAA